MSRKRNIRQLQVFHDYYHRLKGLALSVFEWEGLPETCNARFLEECLYLYGKALFLNDDEYGFINVKATPSSTLNIYNEPTEYHAYSVDYDKNIAAEDCVYIRNNYLEKSTDTSIILFAERLAKIQLAIETNVNAQKTPLFIRCEEKQRATIEALYNKYDGDIPLIIGSKALSEKPIECIITGAPFVADKLREEKTGVWNEALEFLGINTNPSDKKKERLIVNEVNSNNEQIDLQCQMMLTARQEAAEKINKLYGLNVSVKKRIEGEGGAEGWQNTPLNSAM